MVQVKEEFGMVPKKWYAGNGSYSRSNQMGFDASK
jgi:hypothetical protein